MKKRMDSGYSVLNGTWKKFFKWWQALSFHQRYGLDAESSFMASGATLAMIVFYWMHHYVVEMINRKGYLKQYKIQKGKSPSVELYWDCVKEVGMRHAGMPVLTYLLTKYNWKKRGIAFGDLPSFKTFMAYQILYQVIFDTYFYWGHRLVHHPKLYATVHKQHHKFKQPIGICANYASLPEELLVNLPSTLLGPWLFPSHAVSIVFYICLRAHETVDAHSGYEFPWSPWYWIPFHGGPDRHDFHHSNNRGNFGGFVFWDWFCGTDKPYHEWKLKQHKLDQQLK